MELILAACLGMIFGVLMTSLVFKGKTSGKLHIVSEDGDSYMYLELNESVNSVASKKFVTFETTQK